MKSAVDRLRARHSTVVAYLALFVALGGVSYAAITIPANSVGKKQLRKGSVTSGKVRNGTIGRKDLRAGLLPASEPVLWAVVRGTTGAGPALVRGDGAVTAERLNSTGEYVVNFNRAVANCSYVATIGVPGRIGESPPGQVTVAPSAGDATGVFVQTANSAGTDEDRSFHLAVFC